MSARARERKNEMQGIAIGREGIWKLGKVISDPHNVDQCLAEAELGQEITVEDSFYRTEEGKFRRAKNTYFVKRGDTIYQTVSERYRPIQDVEILNMFREQAEARNMSIEVLGSLNDKAIVYCLAKYGEGFKVAGDQHDTYGLMSTSHDGSIAFGGKMMSIRLYCTNQLSIGTLDGGRRKVRHTANWRDKKTEIEVLLKLRDKEIESHAMKLSEYFDTKLIKSEIPVVMDLVSRFNGAALLSAMTTVSAQEVSRANIVEAIVDATIADTDVRKTVGDFNSPDGMNRIGKAFLNTFLNDATMPQDKVNGYGAINAVTRQLDHFAGHNSDSRMRSNWYGSYGRIKETTTQLLDAIVAAK